MALPPEPFIKAVELERRRVPSFEQYPFCLPALRSLKKLKLHPQVTFLIGENGSGKSTLLEAIAVAAGFNAEGGSQNFRFSTRASHSVLSEYLKFDRGRGLSKPKDGFFLRAESFYNVATEIELLDEVVPDSRVPTLIRGYGGRSLHEQSHGESFFALMTNRFGGHGLYLLDEPEAALSPTRQMSCLTLIHQLVRAGSQFIIATHSPILMAYPDATLYLLNSAGIRTVAYEQTEHFVVTRQFLNRHAQMLKILLEEDGASEPQKPS